MNDDINHKLDMLLIKVDSLQKQLDLITTIMKLSTKSEFYCRDINFSMSNCNFGDNEGILGDNKGILGDNKGILGDNPVLGDNKGINGDIIKHKHKHKKKSKHKDTHSSSDEYTYNGYPDLSIDEWCYDDYDPIYNPRLQPPIEEIEHLEHVFIHYADDKVFTNIKHYKIFAPVLRMFRDYLRDEYHFDYIDYDVVTDIDNEIDKFLTPQTYRKICNFDDEIRKKYNVDIDSDIKIGLREIIRLMIHLDVDNYNHKPTKDCYLIYKSRNSKYKRLSKD